MHPSLCPRANSSRVPCLSPALPPLLWSLDHGGAVDPGPCRQEDSVLGAFLSFITGLCDAQEDEAAATS